MANQSGVVTRKGQVTIPAEMRRALNFNEGDRIVFRVIDGRLVIERGEDIAVRSAGMLSKWAISPPPTAEELREMAAEAWAEDASERANG